MMKRFRRIGRRSSHIVLVLLIVAVVLAPHRVITTHHLGNHLVQLHQNLAATPPKFNLTYYSNWNKTKAPVTAGQEIIGDHIVLNATYTPSSMVNKTRIEVNLTALNRVIFKEANWSSIEIDTRELGNNGTCLINVTAWLFNGSVIMNTVENVFLGNFFKPHVIILTPTQGDVWTGKNNITWIAWDNNTDETLIYEVLVSDDNGTSFSLLASGLTETWLEWDCSGFERMNSYVIEVRVSDGIYTSYARTGVFTAGNIIPTTTTTTTTTTSTTTTPTTTDLRPAIFISVSIVTSAFFAVLVYYIAKRD